MGIWICEQCGHEWEGNFPMCVKCGSEGQMLEETYPEEDDNPANSLLKLLIFYAGVLLAIYLYAKIAQYFEIFPLT